MVCGILFKNNKFYKLSMNNKIKKLKKNKNNKNNK